MSFRLLTMGILATILSFFSASPAQSRVIHQQKSLYQDIVVTEEEGRLCLAFTAPKGRRMQSCQYKKQSDSRLILPYVRMSLAGLLLNPNPQRVLLVGLGGGSVPQVLSELYPDAKIDVVELDPAVVKVARDYFHFNETDNMSVTTTDARVFIKRAGMQDRRYDFILLDAFNGDYIPEHLMTQEFLQETKQIMTEDGVLIANTFSSSKLYDHESVTYRRVFGPFFNFKNPRETPNRVIIACNTDLPEKKHLQEQARLVAEKLQRYDVSIERFPKLMSTETDWDTSARVLTDQFSPANLLRE